MIEILEGGIRAPAGNLVAAGVDVGRSGEDLVLEYWILTQECFVWPKIQTLETLGSSLGTILHLILPCSSAGFACEANCVCIRAMDETSHEIDEP